MVAAKRSYILCGTPRTGSTHLCSLLSSTKVLGNPESYFREPDEVMWARRFGLQTDGSRVCDYPAFVRAVRVAGSSDNGVFAARIMWGSLERLTQGLANQEERSDVAALQHVFGPLGFIHVLREDVAAQAVSWCRAEQTGFWHDGDIASGRPALDLDYLKHLVGTITEHNAAWRGWFDRNGVRPHTVTYEQVVRAPKIAVAGVAAELGVELPAGWQPSSPHRKQADQINKAWVTALKSALAE